MRSTERSAVEVERKITNAFCPTTPQKSGADEDEMHLVKDDLKNPCLDYVKHIILSRPGATFSAGGVTSPTRSVCHSGACGVCHSALEVFDGASPGYSKLGRSAGTSGGSAYEL